MFATLLRRVRTLRTLHRAVVRSAIAGTLTVSACVDLNTNPNSETPPAITSQPVGEHVTVGDTASFSVSATGDSLTFQWYKGTTLITGATSNTLRFAPAALADDGLYQVVVTNPAAAIASDTVRLVVSELDHIVGYAQVGGSVTTTNQTYVSVTPDRPAVHVSGAGDLTLINPIVAKSGNATSPSSSSQTGVNAAVLADGGALVTIVDGVIATDSVAASGVFATGAGSSIAMYRGSIVTTGASSPAVSATLGSKVNLEGTSVRATSGIAVSAMGSSVVAISAMGDSLTGSLVSDGTSTLSLNLQSGSVLTGAAQGVAMVIDSTSTWNVTGTSVLTTLTLANGVTGATIANIVGNGFTVYYKANLPANAMLGGITYSLANGGFLVPQ